MKKTILITTYLFSIFLSQLALAQEVSINLVRDFAQKEVVTAEDVQSIKSEVLKYADENGRVTKPLQKALYEFELALRAKFGNGASEAFQTIVATVGGRMNAEAAVPSDRTPYWQKDAGPLDNFKSTKNLPTKTVDYVVIGAGLVGSSAAINLTGEAQNGKEVVVLEMADRPATAASGRNGGNIEMMKENFLEDYRGFVEVQKDFLKERFPTLSEAELTFQAERQSTYLLKFFQANVKEIQKTVRENNIKADISMNGWLRISDSAEEEKGLRAEVEFAKKLGMEFEIWSAEKIKKETGINAKFAGRFIKESGNYHPFKYTNEVLQAAIKKGVKLYTSTKVESVERQNDGTYLVKTNNGTVRTKKILAASNVTTRSIFKSMEYIEPRVSHVLSTEHTTNQWQGMTVTWKKGDWYGHFPKQSHYIDKDGTARAVFHNGGGLDTLVDYALVENPPADLHSFSKDIYHEIKTNAAEAVPDTKGRPGSRFWWGFMAFTPDRMPILSFLYENGKVDRNIVIVMADNGYGGSQAANGGKLGVQMLITGKELAETPEDIFSMRRFHTTIPLFKKGSSCRSVHF